MSIPAWAQQYVGVPFKERGRDRAGWDCWGCVRAVYQEQRGIELPSYVEGYQTVTDVKEIEAMMRGEVASNWVEVPPAEVAVFDGIMLRVMGEPIHFGVIVAPYFFLHALKSVGTVIERYDSILWNKRVLAFMRWRPA